MGQEFVPVLIVGAGTTGLVTANLLGQFGIETLLIERDTRLRDYPRAIAIDDEGLRICQALGLRDEVLKDVLLGIGVQYFSREQLLVRVAPSSRCNGYPRISTFNQPCLEATLLAGLERFSSVEVLFGHTLDVFTQAGEEILVSVRTPAGQVRQMACAYLLACDGGKSSVRQVLRISMHGMTFPQRWLVVDGFCEESTETAGMESDRGQPGPYGLMGRYASFFCDPARPAVSIPAPGQHWRWEFMLHPGEREEQFLTAEALRRLPWQIGDTRKISIIRQIVYTFHAAYATSIAHGRRIFLLGDAAHMLPPFGGQGMSCGLRDAYNLVWKLALVLRGQARQSVLETYEQERMPHVLQMLRFSSFLGNLVMTTSRYRAFLRDLTFRALMKLPPVASTLKEMHIKPAACYKHGLFLAEKRIQGRFPTGHLLPQPTVLLPGKLPVLLDELLGPGFALLRLHSDPSVAFEPLQDDLWQKLGTRYICLVPDMENMPDRCDNITCVLDSQQQIVRFLRGQRDHFALIRPDRHVLGLFRVDREQDFVAALREHFFV